MLTDARFVSGYGFSHIANTLKSARLQPLPFDVRIMPLSPNWSSETSVADGISNEVLAEKILHRVGFSLGFLAKRGRACN
jgi:hypothetical protein